VGILTFFVFTDRVGYLPPTHLKVVAAVTTVLGAYVIYGWFFGLYAAAIDTIAICS
jgi:hypothetical protein